MLLHAKMLSMVNHYCMSVVYFVTRLTSYDMGSKNLALTYYTYGNNIDIKDEFLVSKYVRLLVMIS